MKKTILVIFVITLVFGVTACGGNESANGYLILNKELFSQSYGVAFRNGDDELCDAVSAALAVLAADGTADALSKQFLDGSELSIEADSHALDKLDTQPRTIVVGLTADRPPMAYSDTKGELTGFDVEMAYAVCALLGWTAQYRIVEYDEVAELEAGNVDCLWGGFTITQSVSKKLTCTEPYLSYDQVLVTRADSGYKSFGSLKGETLAIPSCRAAEELLSLEDSVTPKDAEIKEYDNSDACFDALDVGEVQGVIIGSIAAQWYAG